MANEKRLIDVEAIARKLKSQHCAECNVVRKVQCSACWVNDVLELLDGDAVDAVEVVRCKDCKHKRKYHKTPPICYCILHESDTMENNFCSYGERREGE